MVSGAYVKNRAKQLQLFKTGKVKLTHDTRRFAKRIYGFADYGHNNDRNRRVYIRGYLPV
jgi:hypothetical protein